MGDFVTNSQTSLSSLNDQCSLLQNVMHDVLVLEVGDSLDQVRMHCCRQMASAFWCARACESSWRVNVLRIFAMRRWFAPALAPACSLL